MSIEGGGVLYATQLSQSLHDAFTAVVERSMSEVTLAFRTEGMEQPELDTQPCEDLPPRLAPLDYLQWADEDHCLSLDVRSNWSIAFADSIVSALGPKVCGTHAPTEMLMRFGPHMLLENLKGDAMRSRGPAMLSLYLWGYQTPLDGRRYESHVRRSPALAALSGEILRVAPRCETLFYWSW